PDHTGRMYLEGVTGDLAILTWHFPRAAYWLLDRIGVKGHEGVTQIKSPVEDEEESEGGSEPPKGIGSAGAVPHRYIYCVDVRDFNTPDPYLSELRRIATECRERAEAREAARTNDPTKLLQLGVPAASAAANGHGPAVSAFTPDQLLAQTNRRWYP